MSYMKNKYNHSSYPNTSHRTAFPVIRFLFLFVCLFSVSLTVTSAQTTQSSQASRTERANNTPSSNEISDLDERQPTNSECGTIAQSGLRVDAKRHIDSLLQRANEKRQALSCLSSAQSIYEDWSRGEALLIDVRRDEEFQQYQIPSSLNLSPFSIKSKHYFKNKHIVLVNEGHYLSQLDDLCARLKAEGFPYVTVMAGGLHAWHQAGFPIIGDRLALSKLSQISPAELIASLHERDWKFIDLDQSLPGLANLLTISGAVDYQASGTGFISAVNQANSQFKETALTGFLVVSSHGDNYERVERKLQLSDAKNVFYLSGGISEFKHFLNTHSSLISRLARGFKEPHRCSG
jgi:rhodanese-related sulfurtransferase